jgi:hypothetical protein
LDDTPEFVEPDQATKLKVWGLLGVLLLLLLGDLLTFPDRGMIATDPVQALKKSTNHFFGFVIVAGPLCLGASAYLLRLAVRVIRSGQWPPPGMRVAVRTQIRRGRRARLNAILAFVLAGISLLAGPALIFQWHSLSRLASEWSPNKQMPPAPRNGAADL